MGEPLERIRDVSADPPHPHPWPARLIEPAADWLKVPPPKRTWLLRDRRTGDGVLPLGKVGLLAAAGGAGKTMALTQLALAVANGSAWLGVFDVASPGRVLLVLGEEDAEEARRRFFNAGRATRATMPEAGLIQILPLAGVPCALIESTALRGVEPGQFGVWLREHLGDGGEPWRLIVLDPLSRFAGADTEKDNAAATRFVEALEAIAVQTGATVLGAPHTSQASRMGGKLATTAVRGVTALTDGVRWVSSLSVERLEGLDTDSARHVGEVVTFEVTKSNYAIKPAPVELRRDGDHGGALVPFDDVDREIVAAARHHGDPKARREAERTSVRQNAARQADELVAATVARQPGINTRALRATLCATLGIGTVPASDAIERAIAAGSVRQKGSRHAGFGHYTSSSA